MIISTLEKYIGKTIFLATIVATFIITSVVMLMTLLGELKFIGVGDYGVIQVLFFVLLRLPVLIYQYAPMLVLLGSIIGLSILSSHRELAVMRTSGFSNNKIIRATLLSALIMTLILSLLGEWIGPMLSYSAEVNKENAQNAGQAVVTAKGTWLHIDNNFIHVEHIVDRQLLENVIRYQFNDKHDLEAAYFAKSMLFKQNQWIMKDVVKTSFYQERTKSESHEALPLNLRFNPNLLSVNLIDPSEMSLPKLAQFAHYLEKNGLQAKEYQFDFWQRVLQPYSTLVMILMAIPIVLSTAATATLGSRVLLGLLTGLIFILLNALLGQLCIVYQLPTFFAAALPPLLFSCGAFLWCKQLIRR